MSAKRPSVPSAAPRQSSGSSLQAPSAPIAGGGRAANPRALGSANQTPAAPSPNASSSSAGAGLLSPRKSIVKKASPTPTPAPSPNAFSKSIASPISKLADRGIAALRKEKANGSSRFRHVKTAELIKLPDIMEMTPKDRPALIVEKLRQCSYVFDFTDPTSDVRSKDIKRLALNDLRNYFSKDIVLLEEYYPEVVSMFSSNVFRVLPPPEDPNAADFDPEEDDPQLEPSFPHLEIVYGVFINFITSKDYQPVIAKKYILPQFFNQLCEVLGSSDPRERDLIKSILHRMYSASSNMRAHMRHLFSNTILQYVYEQESFQGIAEILEILVSIVNGFALPIKPEHIHMFRTVLLPLFKCKSLSVFFVQLCVCVMQFLEKDPSEGPTVLATLLKYWPRHSSMKEFTFLTLVEDVLETAKEPIVCLPVHVALFKQLATSMSSQHFQVVERTLHMLNNPKVVDLIKANATTIVPILFPVMYRRVNTQMHWSRGVITAFIHALKLLSETCPEVFDQSTRNYKGSLQTERKQTREQEERWRQVEAMARQNPAAKTLPGGLVPRAARAAPDAAPVAVLDEGALLSMFGGDSMSLGVRRRSVLSFTHTK